MNREHLLKKAHHRGSNDLQMVVSLLTLMARQAAEPGQAELLRETAGRVMLLAKARAAMTNAKGRDPCSALRDVCTALQTLAEPRGIVVALHLEVEPDGFNENAITAISMAVNELATNAIKHAFADRQRGTVLVSVQDAADGTVSIFVNDDGAPFGVDLTAPTAQADGLGLGLARRLLEDHGRLVVPDGLAKQFEIVLDQRATPRLN